MAHRPKKGTADALSRLRSANTADKEIKAAAALLVEMHKGHLMFSHSLMSGKTVWIDHRGNEAVMDAIK